jgi:hypothetical protein
VKPNTCFENSAPPLFPLPDWARRLRGGRKLPKASLNPSGGENASRLSKRLWGCALGYSVPPLTGVCQEKPG